MDYAMKETTERKLCDAMQTRDTMQNFANAIRIYRTGI